ncbi:MAG TPA: cell division protein FtsQ/DivIB [Gammaproteobacteria bacterium]|nr:cell division protein FtsQ/DivIB [Gammaproteobacteria bacterium]
MARSNRRKRAARRWRAPRIPRVTINVKALLLPPLALAALALAAPAIQRLLDRPVRTLVIEGTFQRVTPIQIEAALAPGLGRGFLSLDLESLRARLDRVAWVDSVRMRRAWPDKLIVRVTEHRAAARWGEKGLLDARGDLFADRAEHAFPELPELDGPAGTEHEVASLYLALRSRLAAAQLGIESLTLDERGAWRLVLKTGQEIRFGRRDVEERVDRFFAVVAPALAEQFNHVRYVDLRYTNGFAVGWLDEQPAGDSPSRVAAERGTPTHG